ncbi:MAG: diguanylate cyclase [Geminicoccaceae bacterium]
MRQGIGCALCEAVPDSLSEIRRYLEPWRFVCHTIAPDDADPRAPADILLVDLVTGPTAHMESVVAAQRNAGGLTLALCPAEDPRTLSLAASWGSDDILTSPVDPIELVRRLQSLSNLDHLLRERRRRTDLFASYRDGAEPASAAIDIARPRTTVVLLGRPGAEQVQVAAALTGARVTYLRDATGLPGFLNGGALDLLVVTEPALLADAEAAIASADGEAPVMVAAHAGPPWALELPQQIDLLSLPAAMPVVRCRLDIALRVAGLRRWLRDPPLAGSGPMLLDALTGLYNHAAFLDYLRVAGEERAVIGLEHDRLDWINRQSGYAAGNRVLAMLGRSLRRHIRAQDFAAHLGGGRFAVAVAATDRAKLDRLRDRLQATVAEDRPWQILAAAEPMPIRGTPPQRLARLFSDLRRLRPAA